MATEIISIAKERLNVRWREDYFSQGVNRQALALPRGAYRGLWFSSSSPADTSLNLTIEKPGLSLGMDVEQFAIIEDKDEGVSLSFRDASTTIILDCSALVTGGGAQTLIVWIEGAYTTNADSSAVIKVSNSDTPPDDAVVLGEVLVDAGATTLDEPTNCTFDYTNRMTPQATAVDAFTDYGAGDVQFGMMTGEQRYRLDTGIVYDIEYGNWTLHGTWDFLNFVSFASQVDVALDPSTPADVALRVYGSDLYLGNGGIGASIYGGGEFDSIALATPSYRSGDGLYVQSGGFNNVTAAPGGDLETGDGLVVVAGKIYDITSEFDSYRTGYVFKADEPSHIEGILSTVEIDSIRVGGILETNDDSFIASVAAPYISGSTIVEEAITLEGRFIEEITLTQAASDSGTISIATMIACAESFLTDITSLGTIGGVRTGGLIECDAQGIDGVTAQEIRNNSYLGAGVLLGERFINDITLTEPTGSSGDIYIQPFLTCENHVIDGVDSQHALDSVRIESLIAFGDGASIEDISAPSVDEVSIYPTFHMQDRKINDISMTDALGASTEVSIYPWLVIEDQGIEGLTLQSELYYAGLGGGIWIGERRVDDISGATPSPAINTVLLGDAITIEPSFIGWPSGIQTEVEYLIGGHGVSAYSPMIWGMSALNDDYNIRTGCGGHFIAGAVYPSLTFNGTFGEPPTPAFFPEIDGEYFSGVYGEGSWIGEFTNVPSPYIVYGGTGGFFQGGECACLTPGSYGGVGVIGMGGNGASGVSYGGNGVMGFGHNSNIRGASPVLPAPGYGIGGFGGDHTNATSQVSDLAGAGLSGLGGSHLEGGAATAGPGVVGYGGWSTGICGAGVAGYGIVIYGTEAEPGVGGFFLGSMVYPAVSAMGGSGIVATGGSPTVANDLGSGGAGGVFTGGIANRVGEYAGTGVIGIGGAGGDNTPTTQRAVGGRGGWFGGGDYNNGAAMTAAAIHLEPVTGYPPALADSLKGDMIVDSNGILFIYNGSSWGRVGDQFTP